MANLMKMINTLDKVNCSPDNISNNILYFFLINKSTGEMRSYFNKKSSIFIKNKEILIKFLTDFIKKESSNTNKCFNYKTIFLSTKSLCSGRYELWIVIRMRDFNYIIYVKPFNVLFPSCNCKEVANHGYVCQ